MLGFGQTGQSEPSSNAVSTAPLGFAAAQAEAAVAAAAVGASTRSTSSGGSSTCPLPPTYSESVAGVDADDERSSAGTTPRRVWPAEYAATAAAAAAVGRDGGSSIAVRHGAELTEQQQQQQQQGDQQQEQPASAAAASEPEGRVSSRQVQDDGGSAAAVLNSSSTGLVRRSVSRPMSRTPSQLLAAGAGAAASGPGAGMSSMSVDGMVQLPTPGYEYADGDSQPLVPHMMGYAAGQVSCCWVGLGCKNTGHLTVQRTPAAEYSVLAVYTHTWCCKVGWLNLCLLLGCRCGVRVVYDCLACTLSSCPKLTLSANC
jgi:hypothetical protein